jgi:hypothetical protein
VADERDADRDQGRGGTTVRLDLARECLDDRVIGRGGAPIGRVDGIVLAVEPGRAPEVIAIEMGAVVQARRFARWMERAVTWLSRRWGKVGPAPVRIDWNRVSFEGTDCHVDVDPEDARTRAWERWAARLLHHVWGS